MPCLIVSQTTQDRSFVIAGPLRDCTLRTLLAFPSFAFEAQVTRAFTLDLAFINASPALKYDTQDHKVGLQPTMSADTRSTK